MPTATSLSQFTISNLGPLTTTYTAPGSCSTAGYNTLVALASAPSYILAAIDCSTRTWGDCIPLGSAIDSQYASRSDDPLQGMWINYLSPAFNCPSGWSTVGVATKSDDGALITDGIFGGVTPLVTTTITYTETSTPGYNPAVNVLMEAMSPGETAVLCCPSEWIASEGGACYSTIPSLKPTTGCVRMFPTEDYSIVTTTFSLKGQTVTGEIVTITGTLPLSVTTLTFDGDTDNGHALGGPGYATDLVGVAAVPMVTLIHQASDGSGNSGNSSTTPNAANGLRMTAQAKAISLLVLGWTAATLAGVALMVSL